MSIKEGLSNNQAESVYYPDELPPIRDLSADFSYLLSGCTNPKLRRNMAMEYAAHLRERFKPGEYSLADEEYARTQTLPRLFLDMFLLTAQRQRYQSLTENSDSRNSPESLPYLRDLIGAKMDLQQDISDYVYLNPDSDSLSIYGNLVTLMHHSRRVLFGDQVTEEKARQKNLAQLSGILAEYKVLAALQEKWPQASFGSIENDKNGKDIVVPSTKHPTRGTALQVKSSRNPGCQFDILDRGVEVPVVVVPMHPNLHDPLHLSEENSSRVQVHILNFAPKYRLAAA